MANPSQQDIETVGRAIERRLAVDPRLQAFLTREPRTALALTRYAIQIANAGEVAPAREMMEMATLLQPEEPVIWYSRGMIEGAGGMHGAAIESYRRSLALDPTQPQAWGSLGFSLVQTERSDEAAEAYEQALALDPLQVRLRQDLGVLRIRQRRYADAVVELRRAAEQTPDDARLFANLAVAEFQAGGVREAAHAYERARALDPDLPGSREYAAFVALVEALISETVDAALAAYRRVAGVTQLDEPALFKAALAYLVGQGWSVAASNVARAWLAIRPNDPEAAFAVKAAEGAGDIDRAPGAYIAAHFDSFADSFDDKLVGELGYRVPETIAQLLAERRAPAGDLSILDLGCGTGLSGKPLRSFARRLVGVDLAPRMVEKARARRVYDALATAEILDYLALVDDPFDLVVAADLVIYFGDLAALMQQVAKALAPGGMLVLSAELCDGNGWRLLPSGRFAHSVAYLESLSALGLALLEMVPTVIRFEGTQDVPGVICFYQRPG